MSNNCQSQASDTLLTEEILVCESIKELIFSKGFYNTMEGFCNRISSENDRFDMFLNIYFNRDGYVDVWEIPSLLNDLYTFQFEYHSELLEDVNFTKEFIPFIGLFYGYCLTEYGIFPLSEVNMNDIHKNVQKLKNSQRLMNLIMETYSTILYNLSTNITKLA